MEIKKIEKSQWKEIKKIYKEAFPKNERKPFASIKRSVKRGKSEILIALENNIVAGFIMLTEYKDIVMIEYFAVSPEGRGKGVGSLMLDEIHALYKGNRTVLLIERLIQEADNYSQRVARKSFYIRNGFEEANLFIKDFGGGMEVLCRGGNISGEEMIEVQKYALGRLFFMLSRGKLID